MRLIIVLLASAGLSACDTKPAEATADPVAAAVPAAMTFDGADAKDQAARLAHG